MFHHLHALFVGDLPDDFGAILNNHPPGQVRELLPERQCLVPSPASDVNEDHRILIIVVKTFTKLLVGGEEVGKLWAPSSLHCRVGGRRTHNLRSLLLNVEEGGFCVEGGLHGGVLLV